jgi:peptidoglycan/xylan/chitin deacetylase (PgdA/CDA1 family)
MSEAEWKAVLPIIGVRATQVGAVACFVLVALWFWVPWAWFVPLVMIGTVLVMVGLSLYFRAVFVPNLTPLPPSPLEGEGEERRGRHIVFLTFDDGPYPETTPVILDILAQYGARATFFLVAENAERWPDLTRRIAAEGHIIGLHGLRHEAMVLKSGRRIAEELRVSEQILVGILGGSWKERLFRPPHGFKTWTLCRTVHRCGWTMVAWSRDSRDYDPLTAEEIARRTLDGLEGGAVVLLHERPGRTEMLEALPHILAGLRKQGMGTGGLTLSVTGNPL